MTSFVDSVVRTLHPTKNRITLAQHSNLFSANKGKKTRRECYAYMVAVLSIQVSLRKYNNRVPKEHLFYSLPYIRQIFEVHKMHCSPFAINSWKPSGNQCFLRATTNEHPTTCQPKTLHRKPNDCSHKHEGAFKFPRPR